MSSFKYLAKSAPETVAIKCQDLMAMIFIFATKYQLSTSVWIQDADSACR